MRANPTFISFMSGGLLAFAAILATTTGAYAQAAVAITVKGHQFQPAEIHAPANKQLAIHVRKSQFRRHGVRKRFATG